MNFTNIILNEEKPDKTNKPCMFPFREVLKQAKLTWDIEVRTRVTSGGK